MVIAFLACTALSRASFGSEKAVAAVANAHSVLDVENRLGMVMAMWLTATGMPNIDQFSGGLGRSRFSTRAMS